MTGEPNELQYHGYGERMGTGKSSGVRFLPG